MHLQLQVVVQKPYFVSVDYEVRSRAGGGALRDRFRNVYKAMLSEIAVESFGCAHRSDGGIAPTRSSYPGVSVVFDTGETSGGPCDPAA